MIAVEDGLSDWPSDVVVVPGVKPFIYARNCNLGITRAFEDPECDGVVLLNDDALLQTPGGFSRMAAQAKERPEVGILSATCNRIGNPNQRPNQYPTFRYDPRVLAFVCIYIPRWVIGKLGMLDERFTAYGCEDCDYCKRVLDAGLKLGITEECFVDHVSLPSSFRAARNHQEQMMLGRQIYFEKWGVQP
jgi:GT2 family glycosyltransferase